MSKKYRKIYYENKDKGKNNLTECLAECSQCPNLHDICSKVIKSTSDYFRNEPRKSDPPKIKK